MNNLLCRLTLTIAAALFLLSTAVWAQDSATHTSKETGRPQAQQNNSSKKDDHKFALTDVTRVSTEEAAKSAAHKAVADKNKKATEDKADSADSVTEFSPAPPEATQSGKSKSKDSKKKPGAKIHGDAYGGLDPQNSGTHGAGGSVGATSKSGKTSVYVGGGETRSTTSSPH